MIQPIAFLNTTASTPALSPVAIGGPAVFDLSLALLPGAPPPPMQPPAAPGNALPEMPTIAGNAHPAPMPDPTAPTPPAALPMPDTAAVPIPPPDEAMPRASILMDEDSGAAADAPPPAPDPLAAPIARILTAERPTRPTFAKPPATTPDSPSHDSLSQEVQDTPRPDLPVIAPAPVPPVPTPLPTRVATVADPEPSLVPASAALGPPSLVPRRTTTPRQNPSPTLAVEPPLRPDIAPRPIAEDDPSTSPDTPSPPPEASSPLAPVTSEPVIPIATTATPATDRRIPSRPEGTPRARPSGEIAPAPAPTAGPRWPDRTALVKSPDQSNAADEPRAGETPSFPAPIPTMHLHGNAAPPLPAQPFAIPTPVGQTMPSAVTAAMRIPVAAEQASATTPPVVSTGTPIAPPVAASAPPAPGSVRRPAAHGEGSVAEPVAMSSPGMSSPGTSRSEAPERPTTSVAAPAHARAATPITTSPRLDPSANGPVDHVTPTPVSTLMPVSATPASASRPVVVQAQPETTAPPPTTPSAIPASATEATPDGATHTVDRQSPAPIVSPPVSPPVSDAPRLVAGTTAPAFRLFAAAIHAARADESDRATAPATAPLAATDQPRVALPVTGAQGGSLDMTDRRWPHAMVERIERLQDQASATRDAASTSIRLVPDALGTIDVAVRRDGDTVHVRFTAEQAQTRALIADAQPRLQELVEAKGLRLAQSTLGANVGTGADGQAQRQPAPQSQSRSAPARAPRSDDTATDIIDRVA